jgi:hypothetical protein
MAQFQGFGGTCLGHARWDLPVFDGIETRTSLYGPDRKGTLLRYIKDSKVVELRSVGEAT